MLGKRRWDELLQAHIEQRLQDDILWHLVAQNRAELEASFVARVKTPKPLLPNTRRMMGEDGEDRVDRQ